MSVTFNVALLEERAQAGDRDAQRQLARIEAKAAAAAEQRWLVEKAEAERAAATQARAERKLRQLDRQREATR